LAGISRVSTGPSSYDSLAQGDVAGLLAAISRLFAGIPWRNFTANDLLSTEGYYASVLYAFFASLNAEIIPEDISNQGQVDLTIKLVDYIYVIEIELHRGQAGPVPSGVEPRPGDATVPLLTQAGDNAALVQIQARGYSAKYRGLPNKGLFEVGLVFDPQARNLTQADWVAVV